MVDANLFKKINEWLKLYEPVGDWLYFNSTPVELGTTSMNTLPSSSVKEHIDGSKDVTLLFTIRLIKNYDEGTSDINMEALDEVVEFTNWIAEMDKNKDYPDLGEKLIVKEVDVITNVPSLAVNSTALLAQYSFNAKLIYRDESEVI